VVCCDNHPTEASAGTCRSCLSEYCDHCLVYVFGPAKPPYCIRCALKASGITPSESNAGPAPV
jgi:hypothetical protein